MTPRSRQRRKERSHILTLIYLKPNSVIFLVFLLIFASKLTFGCVSGSDAVVRHFKPYLPAALFTTKALKPTMCSFVSDKGLQAKLFYVVLQV